MALKGGYKHRIKVKYITPSRFYSPIVSTDHHYSSYPFLKGALAQYGHITSFDDQSILYAQEHIEKYTPTKLLALDLTVWLISTIMLRCLNNSYLTRKFVSNYGKFVFESRFVKDFRNKEVRVEILEYFGIKKDIKFMPIMDGNKKHQGFVSIHVMDYLEILESGIPQPQFALVNQTLSKGNVYIEVPKFVYLLRLALEIKLIQKIKSMKEYRENSLIERCVKQLDEKYPRFDKLLQAPSKENIPWSIQELIDKAYRENNLNHRERIKLGIYLQSNGFEEDYIMDIFKTLTDYNEKTTRYQLQSLKRYVVKK